VHCKRKVDVDERVRCFKPFPQQFDAAKAIDDPFVTGEQCRVRPKILFVRDFGASRSVLELVNNRERQSSDGSEFTGKR